MNLLSNSCPSKMSFQFLMTNISSVPANTQRYSGQWVDIDCIITHN